MKAELVIEAFNKPGKDVVFHSDKDGQYKAKGIHLKLRQKGFKQSMTAINHCYDCRCEKPLRNS